jgi:cobyrinic acid a,c-diamide synthase
LPVREHLYEPPIQWKRKNKMQEQTTELFCRPDTAAKEAPTLAATVPRILFTGVSSGCGKTTVTCAVLQALVNRGLRLHAFKCGPDYIDPMFHERVIGAAGSNLDLFFYDPDTVRYLLAGNAAEADVSVLEGVMGYYDGRGIKTLEKSTYELARETETPAILIVNGRGMAFSVTALIRGFLSAVRESGIRGVILNNVSAPTYALLKEAILEQFGGAVQPLGFLPPMKECAFESRHLGLVTAGEIADIKAKLNRLAEQAERSIDLDRLLALAEKSAPVRYVPVPVRKFETPVRIAVAMDRAFCFYYRDNLDLLRQMGAELCSFSPLSDAALPPCDALYLGGGYPELYLEQLSGNVAMRRAVRTALAGGMPCIAECGGFMYLTEAIEGRPMVGALPGTCKNQGKLVRFGYITLTAKHDNMLCRAGEQINAHEFHHYDAAVPGDAFSACKSRRASWDCAFATERLYAGYPHLPFYANLHFAENFYAAAAAYRLEKEK